VSANPIIAVDVVGSKLGYATAMGATHTVLDDGDAPSRIHAIAPRGVDFAFVAVGSDAAVAAAWRSLAPGGTCVMLGIMPTGQALSIPTPNDLMGREVRLIGSRYGSARPAIDFPVLVDLYLAGRLRLDELISRRYDLSENQRGTPGSCGRRGRSVDPHLRSLTRQPRVLQETGSLQCDTGWRSGTCNLGVPEASIANGLDGWDEIAYLKCDENYNCSLVRGEWRG
jgi:hypothetical protein